MIPKSATIGVCLAVVVALASTLTRSSAQQNDAKLAQEAFTVFKQQCLKCHGEFGAFKDRILIDRKAMFDAKKLLPGKADDSEIYKRMTTKTPVMPPSGKISDDEIAVIKRWIDGGAPDWKEAAKPQRSFITNEAVIAAIDKDLNALTFREWKFTRYFTITHLHNGGASEEEMQAYRDGLSKLLNSLSWGEKITKPLHVDPDKTIFRIDLRQYGWTAAHWRIILVAHPYGVQYPGAAYTRITQRAETELPFVRADWFVAKAAIPPLYHELLQLPKAALELEQRLGINEELNLQEQKRVALAGFVESGISKNNRIVARHETRYGAYWKSYDFANNTDRKNILEHPLDFQQDGGEVIFNLPNGLQGYMLINAKGDRIDEAPINIVFNKDSAADPVVRNGLTCMSCHTEGMKSFKDQVRVTIEGSGLTADRKAKALAVYLKQGDMDGWVEKDKRRFKEAVELAGGVIGGRESIVSLADRFDASLSLTQVAAELGVKADGLKDKLPAAGTLAVLRQEGGTIKRDSWEEQFPDVVISSALGSLVNPPKRLLKVDYQKPVFERSLGTVTGGGLDAGGPIASLCFSPDGRLIASAAAGAFNGSPVEGVITVWDVQTSSTVVSFQPQNLATSVSFSPDGLTLAVGHESGIDFFDPKTAKLRSRVTVGSRALVFSANGRSVVSACQDGTVRVFGAFARILRGHTGPVSSVAVSPDGNLIASAGFDKILALWDIRSGSLIRGVKAHQDFINQVAFSPDGTLVASGSSDRSVRVWDVQTGDLKMELKDSSLPTVRALAFSPDGGTVACGTGNDRGFRLFDVTTRRLILARKFLKGNHDSGVSTLAFSPDGTMFAVPEGGTIKLFGFGNVRQQ